jgi:hypothetical protein
MGAFCAVLSGGLRATNKKRAALFEDSSELFLPKIHYRFW